MHSLWLPGGLAPPCRVISSRRRILYKRHSASTEAHSVKMANVRCNNSILSLKEPPLSLRTVVAQAALGLPLGLNTSSFPYQAYTRQTLGPSGGVLGTRQVGLSLIESSPADCLTSC